MKVTVNLFAMLRSYGPEQQIVEIPQGTTLDELVRLLKIPDHIPLLKVVNGKQALPRHMLNEGDDVAFLPPISGGQEVNSLSHAETEHTPGDNIITYPCSYIDDSRLASIECRDIEFPHTESFDCLLAKGFRRIGNIAYRTVCKGCTSCKPIRLEVDIFLPSKSQKRTLKKNSDMVLRLRYPPRITSRKIEIFRKYLSAKHPSGETGGFHEEATLLSHIYAGYPATVEMEYTLGKKLVGLGILDVSSNSVSSNYFYYDTGYLDRRLGVFSVLHEISLARAMGKRYYYLGFYIEQTSKMSYKKYFRPNQIYERGRWNDFATLQK